MKKVVNGLELRTKMNEAIDLLCDTVKTTLGPKGSNVIIDHSSFSPFITNDGVTIASNIESDDEVVNTILELAKEASIKTNSNVGDGTTSTLVLLQKIYKEGVKLIEEGVNPILLKKELAKKLEEIIKTVNDKSHTPTDLELKKIAYTSSNSKEIAENIYQAFLEVRNASSIKIIEGKDKTIIKRKNGYIIDSVLASFYFFRDQEEINLDKANILLINDGLNDLEEISELINEVIIRKEKLVILSDFYSDIFINQALSLFMEENVGIYLLKWSEFGKRKIDIMNDLSLITNSKVCDNNIIYNNVGKCKNVKITKEEVTFSYDKNSKIERKIAEIKDRLAEENDDFEREFLKKRLAMFQQGLIEIEVGALTKTERKEKKMRYDDAIGAINSALNGVVLGGGVILYEISESLNDEDYASKIFKECLKEPLKQILYNAGVLEEEIITEIRKNNFRKIYNVKTNKFEDENTTDILDATEVVINILRNALSIASMLLTTSSLIINEYKQEINTNELNI